jgi:endonuclease/exonuclease/phosphatase (EEP) superfamily protein YafD
VTWAGRRSEADPEPATGPVRLRRGPRPGRALLGVLVVVVVALVLVPDRLGLDGTLPLVAFVLVRAPATILVVVLALLALAVRARWWPTVVPVLLIAAVSVVGLLPRVLPDGPGRDAGPDLVVMTLNVDRGSADVEALSRLLHLRRPDLVVLPEAGETFRARLAPLVTDLGYRSWSSTSATQADVEGSTILAGPSLGAVRVDVVRDVSFPWLQLSGGALGRTRLVGAHLAAPVPTLIGPWAVELASLQRWCGPGAGPAAVLGDLNATADLAAYRAGTAGCTDAGDAAGKGLLATWPTATPRWVGAQLDHVLVGGGVGVDGFDVVEVPGTDHRGVLCTVHTVS